METKLIITFDPSANSIYVRMPESPDAGFGETLVDKDGIIVDTDAKGNPRGYEFLSVRERPLPLANLPEQVAHALSNFVSSGALGAEVPVERHYETC